MAEEQAPAAVVEEVKNCPACKKPLKKARRFYRNGAYYCNSNCFKKVQAEASAKGGSPPKADQPPADASGGKSASAEASAETPPKQE